MQRPLVVVMVADATAQADLRECGRPAPIEHPRALRAWAQARLDPLVPDELVAAGDAYVAGRVADARHFFGPLEKWLAHRPVQYTGRRPVATAGADEEISDAHE